MISKGLIKLIYFYRKYISPLKLRSCRFYPTCSEYSMLSIQKFGLFKGTIKSLKRILKCHPFHSGGYDPVD
ncbi:MAG: membrane protein insertion efficiency factor YidD [Candidatus Omnitrophica bacterium]|nr:membrane protein insertion efficiency factor YidD [Candidatus Omnitrophota bacterium]